MGLAGRRKMEREFDQDVVRMYLDQIENAIGSRELNYGL